MRLWRALFGSQPEPKAPPDDEETGKVRQAHQLVSSAAANLKRTAQAGGEHARRAREEIAQLIRQTPEEEVIANLVDFMRSKRDA